LDGLASRFLQVSGNLITGNMITTFHISYTQAGFLSSTFFWAYLIVQVPAGILLDHFGLKKVLVPACALLAIGCVLFAVSQNYEMAILARLVMGIGAGFGFIGRVFAIAEYFSVVQFGLLMGLGELVGMIGTGVGQFFAPHFILAFGWRNLIYLVAALTFALIFLLLASLENRRKVLKAKNNFFAVFSTSFRHVIKLPVVWISGIFCLGNFAILTGFTDIWAVPFLQKAYHFSYVQSSELLALVLLGIAVGGPTLGKISDYTGKPKIVAIITTLMTLFLLSLVIYHPIFSAVSLGILFFCIGFVCSSYLLAFLFIKLTVAEEYKGAASAFCNTLTLIGAVLFQPLTGYLLTRLGTSVFGYKVALAVLPAGLIVGMVCLLLLKLEKA